jgi:hypothetical protein
VRVANENATETGKCFMVRGHELPQGCPKYHHCYETKMVIHQGMISRDSVVTQVSLNVKIAGYVKKRSISVNGNNMNNKISDAAIMVHILRLLVIKHAKQKTVKQQENTVSSEAKV